MELAGSTFRLRPWRADDTGSLLVYANNSRVAANLGDAFPDPYTDKDAAVWLKARVQDREPLEHFAIDVDGTAVGGIGVITRQGPLRIAAAIGYWLGEPFWGRGIATEALVLMTDYAFTTFRLLRLEARVFPWNAASARVLKKAGYHFEVRLRNAELHRGQPVDVLLYAQVRYPADLHPKEETQ
jgi:[ribosomal protein S5]-alanine N-acetyltransferase